MDFAVADTDGGPVVVAIVSDGVSSAPRPDEASFLAVRKGITLLAEGAERGEDPGEVSKLAVKTAGQALNDLVGPEGAAATTYLSAIVSRERITVCWLGDSRAYWLAGPPAATGPNDTIDISGGSQRLTRDDSLAEEIVAAGLATMDEAMASPQAHVITRWLGDSRAYWLAAEGLTPGGPNDTIDITGGSRRITRDDSLAEEMVAAGLASMDDAMASPQAHVITRWLGADLPDPLAHIEQFTPTGPGVLLVASDGLWNYRQEAAELAAMAMPAALERPLDAAADLVKFAIDSGGLDNITVVLIPFPPQ